MLRYFIFLLFIQLIFISCDKQLSVSQPEPPPPKAKIKISTNPPGYSIHLDNRISGLWTPDSFLFLDYGGHTIGLRDSIFLDTTFTGNTPDDTPVELYLDMTTRNEFYGQIAFNSIPENASILINDSLTTLYTPVIIGNVYPGTYKVNFLKAGFRAPTYNLIVKSNKTTNCIGVLEDTTIWLVLNMEYSELPSNFITKIGLDLDVPEFFWVGTGDAGVIDISSNTWGHYTLENSILPAKDITAIQPGSDNRLMIGTNYGLVLIDKGKWRIFTSQNSILPTDFISCITFYHNYFQDRERFYLGLRGGGGIASYGIEGLVIEENINIKLPSLNVSCIHEFNGQLAIGTDDAGVLVYNTINSRTTLYNKDNAGFITNKITAISAYAGMDRIFVAAQLSDLMGNHTGKLYLKDEYNNWRELPLHDKPIYSINIDFMRVWIGTANGLYMLDPSGNIINHFTTENSYLVSNHIYDLKTDRSGNLWLATGNGLVRYKPE